MPATRTSEETRNLEVVQRHSRHRRTAAAAPLSSSPTVLAGRSSATPSCRRSTTVRKTYSTL